jgi:hypothetical protein
MERLKYLSGEVMKLLRRERRPPMGGRREKRG